jgi:hypothetical protein
MDILTFRKKFHEIWPEENPNQYLDGLMSMLDKKAHIDIVRFEELLHRLHDDYREDGQSMSDILILKYGEDVNSFVKAAI